MAETKRLPCQVDIEQILLESQHRWLRPAEICEILQNFRAFRIASKPLQKPSSGSLFLFDRKVSRYFRKDGHNWKKNKDGKTVKEAHERLRVEGIDVLNCYYAHGAENVNFQRRIYCMLDGAVRHIVLVHYREVKINADCIRERMAINPCNKQSCGRIIPLKSEPTIESSKSTSDVEDAVIDSKGVEKKKLLLSGDCKGFDTSLIRSTGGRTLKVGDVVIYGREDDKRKLIQLLLSDDCSELDISLVQIVGAGGVGKSTLAYLVYSDSMACDYFDMKAWVHMPESSDASKFLKAIIESLTGTSCYVTELNELKQIIVEEMSGKRFLIVLDNVRSDIQCFWDSFTASLSIGAKGSIIMVTTRIEIVSDLMGSIRPYHLNNLSDEHCFSIFLEYAFDKQDPWIFPELIQTGKHIVAKCEGNPLAAKALGSLLHFNDNSLPGDIQCWKDVLESSLWESDECFPALCLCYNYLPMHLKLCFRYCSLFPKGYIFEKDHLIRLWMSQGYLESNNGETAEDVGVNCFKDMLRRSFLQCLHIYDAGELKYEIHDLFHDFAQHDAVECFRMEDTKLSYIPGNISHVSLVPCAVEPLGFSDLFKLQRDLWTFLIIYKSASKWPGNTVHIENISVLSDLFIKCRYLRSLDLSNTDIKELPDSIKSLKCLCYLSLNNTNIRRLPNSICSLHSLQTLELQDCCFLFDLPPNIKELTKLRCLNVFKDSGFISMPSGIGELRNLRALSNFNVGKVGSHCKIMELENLSHLRGSLCIAGLENVVSGAQANQADLKTKGCLKTLTLHWFQNGWELEAEAEQNALDVLQNLQPHTNLEEVIIHGYFGSQFPTWLGHPLFCNLVSVTLDNCYESNVLPPLGQLPSLRFLSLQKMDNVLTLGLEFRGSCSEFSCGFPSLEILKLWEMSELEEWNWVKDEDFPQLRSLSISMCFKLIKLPPLNNLRELVFHCCHRLPEIPRLKSLEYLKIDGFQKPEFLSLPDDLPALKILEINNCGQLSRLFGMSQLASVKQFKVSKCPQLNLNECWAGNSRAVRVGDAYYQLRACDFKEVRRPYETSLDLSNKGDDFKKYDSFSIWMSEGLGEVGDAQMKPSSSQSYSNITESDHVEESCMTIVEHLDLHTMSPSVSQDQFFNILDISPNWVFTGFETKVIITGTFLKDSKDRKNYKWSCMFGDVEVSAEIIADGVLRCDAPSHKPGTVPFYITCFNRLACSEVREFEFREYMDTYDSDSHINELYLHARLEKLLSLGSLDKCSSMLMDGNDELFNVLNRASGYADGLKDNVLQKLLKRRLRDGLLQKIAEGGKGLCILDKEGQGMLHLAAAIGYDWAIKPTITAGVGINFRDARGWTALHWAAFCGRERTVVSLVTLGAAPGALTDPTPEFPSGKTPADLASANGHKGIAGFLAESSLTAHLETLTLKDGEDVDISEITCTEDTENFVEYDEDALGEPFMKDSLSAVRKATLAAARIHQVFRVQSFQRKKILQYNKEMWGMSDKQALSLLSIKANKPREHNTPAHIAAIRIQSKFRGWKKRKEYLITRQGIGKNQAHVRGHQVRYGYKKIIWTVGIMEKVILRWRRKGRGLRGFRSKDLLEGSSDQDALPPNEDDYDFLQEGRKQVDARMQEALARVKSMVQYPEARDQYRRLLSVVSELQKPEMLQDRASHEAEDVTNDDFMMEIEELREED